MDANQQTITIHGRVISRGKVLGWSRLTLERGLMVLMLLDNPKFPVPHEREREAMEFRPGASVVSII